MKYIITTLTKTESGTYNESGNVLPDMLEDGECPATMGNMLWWLSEQGYKKTEGFRGWGTVLRQEETGELLSLVKDD